MATPKETEAKLVLEAYQSALDRLGGGVEAMEEALHLLDAFRASDDHPTGDEPPIPVDILFANRLRTRANVLRCLAAAFIAHESRISLDNIARRLGTTRRKVKKMMSLRGSSGRDINQISDVLLALGSELDFGVEHRSEPEPPPADEVDN
jgi:hypothetical protein